MVDLLSCLLAFRIVVSVTPASITTFCGTVLLALIQNLSATLIDHLQPIGTTFLPLLRGGASSIGTHVAVLFRVMRDNPVLSFVLEPLILTAEMNFYKLCIIFTVVTEDIIMLEEFVASLYDKATAYVFLVLICVWTGRVTLQIILRCIVMFGVGRITINRL
ncbi:hypothetical protein MBLNU459_g0554t1 [Dothideomycetes sp. NU459]